jgi:hypothetical protein
VICSLTRVSSTCLGRLDKLCRLSTAGGEGAGRFMSVGVRDERDGGGLHVPAGQLARLADAQQLACTPSGCVFVTPGAREGVLPRMLREVRAHNSNAEIFFHRDAGAGHACGVQKDDGSGEESRHDAAGRCPRCLALISVML